MSNTNAIVSKSRTDYATYSGGIIGILSSGAKATVKNNGTLFPAGTTAGFEIETTSTLLNIDVLKKITISTLRTSCSSFSYVEQNVQSFVIAGIDIIGGYTNKAKIAFKTTKPFNAIQLDLWNGILDVKLVGTTRIYGAYVFEDADGFGDCIDLCPIGNDAYDTDGDGIPDACDVCKVTNVKLEFTNTNVSNNCDSTNPNVAKIPVPENMPANPQVKLEYHTSLNPTRSTLYPFSEADQTRTLYAFFYDQEFNCYSIGTSINVKINSCIKPDLEIYSLFGADWLPSTKEGWGINVKNVNNASTTAPIVVTVASDNKLIGMADISYDSLKNELTINGTVFTLTNPNYTVHIVPNTQTFTFTSKPGHILAGNSEEVIGLEIVKSEENDNRQDARFYLTVNGGGEDNVNDRNNDIQYFKYNPQTIYSINANLTFNNLEVYPNPASECVIVRGTKIGDVIRIVDITGKVILSQDASIANTINTSKLATGNYVL